MEPGLYEKLMTAKLRERLAELGEKYDFELAPIDSADSPLVLTKHFSSALTRVLEGVDSKKRLELVNGLLEQLQDFASEEADPVLEGLEQLVSVRKVVPLRQGPMIRPSIPLNSTDLLINARGEHRVGTEIIKELASANRVDLLIRYRRPPISLSITVMLNLSIAPPLPDFPPRYPTTVRKIISNAASIILLKRPPYRRPSRRNPL